MADRDGIWSRGGVHVEDLPDPFAPIVVPPGAGEPVEARPKPKRSRRRIIFYSIAAALLVTLLWLIVTAPLSRALEPLDDPALLLLSQEGIPIARRGAIKEAPVEASKLDPLTPAAFVAIEDRRFYRHWGIDPRAIGRAMVANLSAGGVRQGGSTITQQLAKTSFLSSDRSLKRKAQEVIISFWLEAWLTKEEILSRYLSSIYFGDGVYGLRAAARHYFNRNPENLSLAQSAMLAGLAQAPSRLAPTHNLAAAQKRSRMVLGAMAETGIVSAAARPRDRSRAPGCPVIQAADRHLFCRLGRARRAKGVRGRFRRGQSPHHARRRPPAPCRAGGQPGADRRRAGGAGRDAARRARGSDGRRAQLSGKPVQSRRPGPAPTGIGVQAVRLSRRDARRLDAREHHRGPAGDDRRLDPGQQRRRLSRTDHLARGLCPVEQCGDGAPVGKRRPGQCAARRPRARHFQPAAQQPQRRARHCRCQPGRADLGLCRDRQRPLPDRAARLALDGQDEGFSSFFRRGGSLDERRDWAPMLDLLWEAANKGTGRRAALAVPTFGKTGTSQDNRDALFIGFAGNLVVGVWVGRDDNKSLGKITGGSAPAQIWRNFMLPALSIDGRAGPRLPQSFHVPAPPRQRAARTRRARCPKTGATAPAACATSSTKSRS